MRVFKVYKKIASQSRCATLLIIPGLNVIPNRLATVHYSRKCTDFLLSGLS